MATKAANFTNASIANYAEAIGLHHDVYSDEGGLDIHRLLNALGGHLDYAEGSESLTVRRPGDFTIHLPHFTSSRRDRFTISHELGHYFLHYLLQAQKDEALFARGDTNRAETEANIFASALLMPEGQFRAAWQRLDRDKWAVSNLFEVSPAAADVRAQVLKLI